MHAIRRIASTNFALHAYLEAVDSELTVYFGYMVLNGQAARLKAQAQSRLG